jgi:hypothetical protein
LFGAIAARGVQFIRTSQQVKVVTELEEKGCQQAADIALGNILEVKVVVCDQCWSGLRMFLMSSIIAELYPKYKYLYHISRRETAHHRMLFPAPAAKSGNGSIDTKVERLEKRTISTDP